ncbi:probable proline--tRNA ligase, mitochondrial [Neodiprion pinetum]|uniref:probable proline--tRNA ligase, mitochondrial n=1 Tax=Neodiprion pinetum TaxID=441929 RepID=UPI001EE1281C|nr:probable proline--tRNA ligase, mitochondrial [Neodiprion pinetum]
MSKKLLPRVNRISKLFQPLNIVPKDSKPRDEVSSKSYKLMVDMGIIRQSSNGMYNLLPLGLRALEKLNTLVDDEMANIDAQKVLLPHLIPSTLWKATGRLEVAENELFMLHDRHQKQYILSPTHEEAVTSLIASVSPLSKKMLPIKLYQISSKWRDEMKPRLGVLRGREFIMKDLYTFDADLDKAKETYDLVCKAYDNLFQKIGVEFVKVAADTGIIGGSFSNEYHYVSNIGETVVVSCTSCNYFATTEIHNKSSCPQCQRELCHNTSVEVGHTFLLGTKYSEPLKATYTANGKPVPLVMGCFGLGLTRILGAALEILSSDEELRWPRPLVPYNVCVMPPKNGSKEASASRYADNIYQVIEQSGIDVILDDRTHFTIGKRMIDARRTGYPYIVVVGKRSTEPRPMFEIHDLYEDKRLDLSFEGVIDYLRTTNDDQTTRYEMNEVRYKSN